MIEENSFRFLPLGTFVKLKDRGDKIFVVVARALQKGNQGIYVKYRLAEHPDGDKPNARLPIVADDQVVEIVHEGYKNKDDDNFLEDIIEKAKQAQQSKIPVEEIPEPNFTISLDTSNTVQNLTATSKTLSHIQASDSLNDSEERLKKDPFYKFKKEMN